MKQAQLSMHIKINHKKLLDSTYQYNCDDCPYQGTTSLELRKHVRSTFHTPSTYKVICYTCKNEFESYRDLMDHRKAVHPSQKVCRYFQKGTCYWKEEKCWYKHLLETSPQLEELFPYSCQECDTVFKTQSELIKHKKHKHRNSVSKCRDYMQGKCDRDENSCGFLHDEKNMETEQDFHDAPEKIPPDQRSLMMNMLTSMMRMMESSA